MNHILKMHFKVEEYKYNYLRKEGILKVLNWFEY